MIVLVTVLISISITRPEYPYQNPWGTGVGLAPGLEKLLAYLEREGRTGQMRGRMEWT